MGLIDRLRLWWRNPADRIEVTLTHTTIEGNGEKVMLRTTVPARTGMVELKNLIGRLGGACAGRKYDSNEDVLALRDWLRELERERLGLTADKPVVKIPDDAQLSIDARVWKKLVEQRESEKDSPDIVGQPRGAAA